MDQAIIKQRVKQTVRRTVGEPYVGKRLKLRRVGRVLRGLDLHPCAILDAGAEDATFVYWLAERYTSAHVLAVDIDDAAISACLAARPARYTDRVEFRQGSFADLAPDTLDLITAFDVFEHIKDDAAAAADLARALRPGGHLLVHVPRDQWTSRAGKVHRVADEDAWHINIGHVRSGYSPKRLRELLEAAGLHVVDVELWTGWWGMLARDVYSRLEHPAPLRILSMPVTDVCAVLDGRCVDGNTVFAHAIKQLGRASRRQPRCTALISRWRGLGIQAIFWRIVAAAIRSRRCSDGGRQH